MVPPTPNQHPSNTPGPSATSWSRSGEPGSAFSGSSSRGGRGRGSGRSRSGRNIRGVHRETKPIGAEASSDKPNLMSTSKPVPLPSVKPGAIPSMAAEKAPVIPNASPYARPRKNSRRTSRSVPAVVAPPVGADVPSNPGSSKPPSRRRRSQTGKTAPTLAKDNNVPSHDDNLLRPPHPRIGPVPHIASIKDVPPHLTSNSINKHTDVDAVPERVDAVDADDRSHTPGSHIDWAGDDDDSLPDLDDWGITSIKVATNENGLISPLGVSGLRPLPDIVTDAQTSSPHQKIFQSTNGVISDETKFTLRSVKSPDNGITNSDDVSVAAPMTTTQEPLVSAPASAKVSLCPSLPPDAASVTSEAEPVLEEIEVTAPLVKVERGLAASIYSPNANADKEDPFSNLLPRNGLAASIHAPHPAEITGSKSVPSDTSLYLRASPEHGKHNRSHPIGRPPSYARADNNSRSSRSGYNTPRGRVSARGSSHARTHSTPPEGSHTRRSPAHRPVLTGDAISRLAKTIGGTTLSRVPAISAAQE
ncbi:hypothetical protein H2248_006190 [Termitomyces sp. 'cryptogamus']|nr:hypothetical protein H2248_006190 [Termitomyces sp. 'cryptogamus']